MGVTEVDVRAPAPPRRPPPGVRLLRVLAWTFIVLGVLVGLYLVYSLFFTNLQTSAAQDALLRDWAAQVADPAPAVGGQESTGADGGGDPAPAVEETAPGGRAAVPHPVTSEDAAAVADSSADNPGPTQTAPPGEAVALLWFERPGEPAPVTDEPYVVLSGVGVADLARGPGHYPQTAQPGDAGNFAVAGHRTTHGAPFFHLDDLQEGDEIRVMDAEGRTHVYAFAEQRIVPPTDVSVLDTGPLGVEGDTITLTTCHPRFSNRQRMIVVGELVS